MAITLYGINHQTAPVAIREQVSVARDDLPNALQSLLGVKTIAANEAVILSTCHRTELYSSLLPNEQTATAIVNWLAEFHRLSPATLEPHLYSYQDDVAVRHLMKVASGLSSMSLGEPEILGQVKDAYSFAQSQGAVGATLSSLFEAALATAKQVRTETTIGTNTLSLSYAIITLAKRIFSDITETTVLLIGTGDVIQSTATYLKAQNIHKLLVASRPSAKASQFAEHFQAQLMTIGDIPAYLPQTDIVISATASRLPLLGKGAIERTLKVRKHKPLLLVDLAVPRDIEPEIAELDDVFLYNIDDLQTTLMQNRQSREAAIQEAEAIIDIKTQRFIEASRVLKAARLIQRYREQATRIQASELQKAQKRLARGETIESVLQKLAHALTNKLTHQPTVSLREAAASDDQVYLTLLNELFNFSPDIS